MRGSINWIVGLIMVGLSGTPALAAECADNAASSENIAKAVLACLKQLELENTGLQSKVNALESRLEAIEFPRGAVVAFDRDDLAQDKCPDGWSPFKNARARVIIGAGDPQEAPGKMGFDEYRERLKHYVLGQHGGGERVVLQELEMPIHHHVTSQIEGDTYGYVGGPTDLSNTNLGVGHKTVKQGKFSISGSDTSTAGGNASHNNMPPFIALYYCKNG